MHAEHGLRTREARSDGIDIEIRGVGGEDGVGLGQPIELAEHLLLDRHFLRYRFDDDVRLADGLDVGDAVYQAESRLHLRRARAAARAADAR